MSNIPGVEQGTEWSDKAAGSKSEYRFDTLPPLALAAVARLRCEAIEKHGEEGIDNWRNSKPNIHVNKALIHIFAYLAGDTQEKDKNPAEHLIHALCRMMFAVEILEIKKSDVDKLASEIADSMHEFHISTDKIDHALDASKYMQLDIPNLQSDVDNMMETIRNAYIKSKTGEIIITEEILDVLLRQAKEEERRKISNRKKADKHKIGFSFNRSSIPIVPESGVNDESR